MVDAYLQNYLNNPHIEWEMWVSFKHLRDLIFNSLNVFLDDAKDMFPEQKVCDFTNIYCSCPKESEIIVRHKVIKYMTLYTSDEKKKFYNPQTQGG